METNPEKHIELIFHNIHDHGVSISDMWIREVEQRTGGRVRFVKQSGEDREAIARADVIRDVPADGERYPLLNLVQIPFIFPSATIGSRVIARLYEEFSELREELNDVKVVGLGLGALMAIFSSRSWGPIKTAENFKNARIRSLTPIDCVFEAFGAEPRHVGYLEISRLLEAGELDATVLGMLPAWMFKLAEGPAPYCTIAGDRSITMHPMRTWMKWESWDRLPPDIQAIIDGIGPSGAGCWFATHTGPDADAHLRESLDYFRQHGEIITIPENELDRWRQLAGPCREAEIEEVAARGLPAREFVARMMELVEVYTSGS